MVLQMPSLVFEESVMVLLFIRFLNSVLSNVRVPSKI